MSYSLIVRPEAELDILESSQWYEDKQENLGVRFLDEVEEKIHLITQNPLHYQVRYKNTRLALIKHFPYAIHFIVNQQDIIVLAVLGTREDSEKWV
ncbi:type II toxin-antitoxin system RelE/ParE family toxin [Marivirga salinae]|uniref:Type II toxin-antitoxin system RelE/ParE family toxin n=1 Tax=Marivirga salinarum TaxID=3059078 RepID=A0AA49J950_9BACT|nr:type II toxin-antitoxin system RelE/ParE family toxin [Marivirga sp. BDSF4-3]WKK74502.1 type II toxin-antitoxin system RelE/ParE family toxin [Marivirga sp. BDSF4-3]